MASCFVCGCVDEDRAFVDGEEYFVKLIYNFLKKNDIHTVYTLNRNIFDDIVEDAINTVRDGVGANVVKVAISKSPSVVLEDKLLWNDYYKDVICPYDEELDPLKTYKTLYGWMIDNSEYMITHYIDDSDICLDIANAAEKSGVKVFNIADKISVNKLISFSKKEDSV